MLLLPPPLFVLVPIVPQVLLVILLARLPEEPMLSSLLASLLDGDTF